ncbi:hypothetical protein NQ318_016657 [Aromia moschata]|uniref:EF-hand domain-containing protein n=1 Tax=Aromia moschata TaxID=1265417 RepID=A0AAV8X3V5_9CUCU|nr:hypothetical protein NQ318_016657 [Aromia moschata]
MFKLLPVHFLQLGLSYVCNVWSGVVMERNNVPDGRTTPFVLRKAFEAFDNQKSGSIPCDMVADILRLMGQPFDKKTWKNSLMNARKVDLPLAAVDNA